MLENAVDEVTGRRSSLARHTCIAWSLGGGLASLAIPVCLKMLLTRSLGGGFASLAIPVMKSVRPEGMIAVRPEGMLENGIGEVTGGGYTSLPCLS